MGERVSTIDAVQAPQIHGSNCMDRLNGIGNYSETDFESPKPTCRYPVALPLECTVSRLSSDQSYSELPAARSGQVPSRSSSPLFRSASERCQARRMALVH